MPKDHTIIFLATDLRNVLIACDALNMPVSPSQALTLAKHRNVSNYYTNGIPLSEYERKIAITLTTIDLEPHCKIEGAEFDDAHMEDVKHMVRFGENGITVLHKIGAASG